MGENQAIRQLALLIPVNRKGHVLLQHRTADAPRKPDHWAFFGGHIEIGETPAEAAMREFEEELKIKIRDMKFFRRYIFEEEDGSVVKFFFMLLFDESVSDLKSQQQEGDDLGYFRNSDLKNLKISTDDHKVLDDFMT